MWEATASVWATEICDFPGEVDSDDGKIQKLCLKKYIAESWLSVHTLMLQS